VNTVRAACPFRVQNCRNRRLSKRTKPLAGGRGSEAFTTHYRQRAVYAKFYKQVLAFAALLLSACGMPHGQPQKDSEILAPHEVLEFSQLYSENCAGCHGEKGRGGAAIALADPVYLAVAADRTIRNVTTNGVRGTAMPAFAESAGGLLTDKQIDVITQNIRSRWGKPGILDGVNPPSYASKSEGDPQRGQAVYKTYCESCHGPEGRGGPKGSAITDGSFLALVSDQGLRTEVIAGRPELGAPDWRRNVPGRPMSDQEVTDVVAWLASRRVEAPGQPYSAANYPQH
jgi:cytochrome c oxidase cbb3-type subunit III